MQYALQEVAAAIGGDLVTDSKKLKITSLAYHVNHCKEGALFFAIKGSKADGHRYISEAFSRGAVASVVEDAEALGSSPGIVVQNSKLALSKTSALFFGTPTVKLSVIGVTGTNGKTTTHWMIDHLLQSLGKKVLRVGTIGIHSTGFADVPNPLTTPGPLELQKLFAEAVNRGIDYAVMEVSSHALTQHRVEDVRFDAAIFTNLSRDHLDYHSSIDEYATAKMKLFSLMRESGKNQKVAIVNGDDEYAERFLAVAAGLPRCLTYGFNAGADLLIKDFSQSISGSSFTILFEGENYRVTSPFIGEYNAYNLVAAIATCVGVGFSIEEVFALTTRLPQVPGRLQSVGDKERGVFVDYAHTPDALYNALGALRSLTTGKLWTIFGCGGDRDRGKRPQMGHIAAEIADRVVITSDNPRTEDPKVIIEDILSSGIKPALVEADRKAAIEKTLSRLSPGDVLLIAGKGHEDYQIIGSTKYPFSDVSVVQDYLQNRS